MFYKVFLQVLGFSLKYIQSWNDSVWNTHQNRIPITHKLVDMAMLRFVFICLSLSSHYSFITRSSDWERLPGINANHKAITDYRTITKQFVPPFLDYGKLYVWLYKKAPDSTRLDFYGYLLSFIFMELDIKE